MTRSPGRAAAIFADWQSCTDGGTELRAHVAGHVEVGVLGQVERAELALVAEMAVRPL